MYWWFFLFLFHESFLSIYIPKNQNKKSIFISNFFIFIPWQWKGCSHYKLMFLLFYLIYEILSSVSLGHVFFTLIENGKHCVYFISFNFLNFLFSFILFCNISLFLLPSQVILKFIILWNHLFFIMFDKISWKVTFILS